MKKKLIIFDMDGTLVNSSVTIANAINYVRQNLNLEPMDKTEILQLVNEHTINPARTFYNTESFEEKHEKWFSEYYSKNHDKELELYDGIYELLVALKEQGRVLAIATNAYRNSTLESLTYLNIFKLFDGIACYDDVLQGKPYPDMLFKLLDELGYKEDETIFIGDGPRDELASKEARIDYIMVDWGFTEHSKESDIVYTVEDLKETLLHV